MMLQLRGDMQLTHNATHHFKTQLESHKQNAQQQLSHVREHLATELAKVTTESKGPKLHLSVMSMFALAG